MSNACYSKQGSGVLNISSTVIQCGRRCEDGLSKVLKIVTKVGRRGKYKYDLGGFYLSGDIILAAIQVRNNLESIT